MAKDCVDTSKHPKVDLPASVNMRVGDIIRSRVSNEEEYFYNVLDVLGGDEEGWVLLKPCYGNYAQIKMPLPLLMDCDIYRRVEPYAK